MADVLPIVKTILSGIQLVRSVGNENQKLGGEIDGCLRSLGVEVSIAKWDIAKDEGVDQKLAVEMQELLFNIESYVYELSIPEGMAALGRGAVGMESRAKYIAVMDSFISSIKSIRDRQQASSKSSHIGDTKEGTSSSAASPPYYAPENELEGFPKTKVNFRQELLSPAVKQLRVVSIVGCSGMGKTALARAVFDDSHIIVKSTSATKIPETISTTESATDSAINQVHCKAWVVASTCNDAGDLLNKVLKDLDSPAATGNTAQAVRMLLDDKRYLIVIEYMQPHGVLWKDIKQAFPENDKGSRIIVTTSVHSIARASSSASYYVYQLQCLNIAHSKRLFWKKVYGPQSSDWEPSEIEIPRSERIFDKCGGLPLALISTANYMVEKEPNLDLSEDRCKDICKILGNYLERKERAFDDLKSALSQCYENLPNIDHKNCLLYLSIFPRGYQISSKSLARRLLAEEFVAGDGPMKDKIDNVRQWLERLIDHSIIEPVIHRNNSEVAKRFRAHGTVLDFTIQKSLSKNLVTLLGKDSERHGDHGGRVHRLTVQSSTKMQNNGFLKEKEEWIHLEKQSKLSSVRSLTIFNSGIVEFKSCKMMRVLDLEGCSGLDETVLRGICELVLLKYLRLREPSVKELPEELKKLKHLQTLDIGSTPEAVLLPVVVIMLPALAYLFGRFKLPPSTQTETSKLKEFLESKSELHTFSGIVIDDTDVLETIVLKARKLEKVKIWGTHPASMTGNIPSTLAASSNSAPIAPAALGHIHTPAQLGRTGVATPSAATAPSNTPTHVTLGKNKSWVRSLFGGSRKSNWDHVQKSKPRPSTFVPPHLAAVNRLLGILVSSQLQSVYIESSGFCKAFLSSLQAPCGINSIKLRGGLTSLPDPDTLKELRCLNKLHLSLTGLSCQALSALQNLFYLEYLTIVEDSHESWKDSFILEDKGFPCLKMLCFEGPKHPPLEIQSGGMQHLASLKLLCKEAPAFLLDKDGNRGAIGCPPGFKGISHLAKLNEVILHHDVSDENLKYWKEAAMNHANMPCVRKQPAPQPIINEA